MTRFSRLVILLTLLAGGSGCDAVRSAKRSIKGLLFGVKIEENKSDNEIEGGEEASSGANSNIGLSLKTSGKGSPGDAVYKNAEMLETDKNSKNIVQVSQKEKIFNLCEAYVQQGDPSIKSLFIRAIHEGATLFGPGAGKGGGKISGSTGSMKSAEGDADSGLESCLLKLDGIVANGGDRAAEVMDVIFEWHLLLKGKNHEMVEKIWATSQDNIPLVFFKRMAAKLDYKNCPWGALSTVPLEEQRKREFLLERKARLTEVMNSEKFRNSSLEKFYILNCVQRIEGEMSGNGASRLHDNQADTSSTKEEEVQIQTSPIPSPTQEVKIPSANLNLEESSQSTPPVSMEIMPAQTPVSNVISTPTPTH